MALLIHKNVDEQCDVIYSTGIFVIFQVYA